MSQKRDWPDDWRVDNVVEWMDNQIHHAEHSVGDLKRSRDRFVDNLKNNDNHDTIVSSVGWFVNDIQNIIRNYRMDNAPDKAVYLAQYLAEINQAEALARHPVNSPPKK